MRITSGSFAPVNSGPKIASRRSPHSAVTTVAASVMAKGKASARNTTSLIES